VLHVVSLLRTMGSVEAGARHLGFLLRPKEHVAVRKLRSSTTCPGTAEEDNAKEEHLWCGSRIGWYTAEWQSDRRLALPRR